MNFLGGDESNGGGGVSVGVVKCFEVFGSLEAELMAAEVEA